MGSFQPSQLTVIGVITNPLRYESRYRLFDKFKAMMHKSGVRLVIVEGVLGDRHHKMTEVGNELHVQVQIVDEVWHKENLINVGLSMLRPADEYVCWCDGDIYPDEHNVESWATETIHALQHYKVVQGFNQCIDRGPRGEVLMNDNGCGLIWTAFTKRYAETGIIPNLPYSKTFGHTGYIWAARRETLDELGGLMDLAILGAADHHMALAFVGAAQASMPKGLHPHYYDMVNQWQDRAVRHVGKDIGWVNVVWNHEWHGRKADRRYIDRWDILKKWQYDPCADVKYDTQGVLRLTEQGLRMQHDLRLYFRSRLEDANEVVEPATASRRAWPDRRKPNI